MLEIIILTILIVVAFIAAGWYTHSRNQQQARAFERELDPDSDKSGKPFRQRFDAVFEQELHTDQSQDSESPRIMLNDDRDDDAAEPFILTADEPAEIQHQPSVAQDEEDDVVREWDLVIALTIMAPAEALFSGKALKNVLENHDLHFGDMQIYHRYLSDSRKQPLFSIANILDPGTLLPDQLLSMQTPGVLLFARLPGPMNGMALFDLLLDTAEQMSAQLGGVLCDDQRQPLTDKSVEALRNRIFEFNIAMQSEQKSASDDYFN